MAADIIGYDADFVPVGKDQQQHLEMTKDIASSFNHAHGETFVLPEGQVQEDTKLIPGTDGAKMSKSKENTINIFLNDKKLRKQIMGIQTDSTSMEDPKNPDTCNVFALYTILGTSEKISAMRANYQGGDYGYGHAKQALFELIIERFSEERLRYNYYMENLNEIDKALEIGAAKATNIANDVLSRVRLKLGY